MNHRKKTAGVLSAMVLLAVTACSGAPATTPPAGGAPAESPADAAALSGNITVRVYPLIAEDKDREFWTEQAALFTAANPGTEVAIDVQPWRDRETALSTAITGGTAPDVAYMIPDELRLFQSQGALAPLQLQTDGIRPNALEATSVDGEVYGAPVLMSVVPGVCDAQAMEKAGFDKAPATWDEVKEMGATAKEQGLYIMDLVATNAATLNTSFYPFVWQAGGDVFDAEGNLSIDSPEAIEAVAFMRELVELGYVHANDATEGTPLEQSSIGRREVVCTFMFDPVNLEPIWGDDRVIVPPLRHKEQRTYGTVGSHVVLKGTQNPDLAQAWVNFVSSADTVRAIDTFAGYQSPRSDVDLGWPADSVNAEVAQYLDLTYSGAPVAAGRAVQAAIAPQVQSAVLGQVSPEEAMKAAQDAGAGLA